MNQRQLIESTSNRLALQFSAKEVILNSGQSHPILRREVARTRFLPEPTFGAEQAGLAN
jgi:hypothetical protein